MNEGTHRTAGFDQHMRRLAKYCDIKGMEILEIGTDRWLEVPRRLEASGAHSVVATNIARTWPQNEVVSPCITKMRADMRRLSRVFKREAFDLVFGMAVVEHVRALWLALEEAASVLKPGGILYLQGAPLWTSSRGHHLFTKFDGKQYRFRDEDCPILEWEHLLYDDEDMLAKAMMDRGVAASLASHLAKEVYRNSHINRFGYSRLRRIFGAGPLHEIAVLEASSEAPSPEVGEAIRRGPWGDEDRFDVTGLTFVMQKRE